MQKSKINIILFSFLFIEALAGIVWGIQRGVSSLFAKEVLMITSFAKIGMITSVFGITKALTNLGMGIISDRIGRKPVIIAGCVISALGGIVIANSLTFLVMLIGTALIGLGSGSLFVGIMVSITEVIPQRTGLGMGLFELAAYGGSTVGTSFAGYLSIVYGLRHPFTILMIISIILTIASIFLIPETKPIKNKITEDENPVNVKFYIHKMWAVYLTGFSSKIMDSLVVSFLPLYLTQLNYDIGMITTIMSAFTFSWALLQPISGHISDVLGRKKIIIIGLAISILSVLSFTLTDNYILLVSCSLILGTGAAIFYTPLVAMASDIAPPDLKGTLIGSYRFFRDMGYFIGPILLGVIADSMGLMLSFYVTSIILLGALVAVRVQIKETIHT